MWHNKHEQLQDEESVEENPAERAGYNAVLCQESRKLIVKFEHS